MFKEISVKLMGSGRGNLSTMLGQGGIIALIFVGAYFLLQNTQTNLELRGIESGFEFLQREAGLPIGDSLFPYSPADTYGYAFLIGMANTVYVSLLAIFFSTILGVVIGVARVSPNWLVAKLAEIYVETLRNIPLLLTLIFTYAVVIASLPKLRQALNPVEGVFLSQRGLVLPDPVPLEGMGYVAISFLAALFLSFAFGFWARKYQDRTGVAIPAFWLGAAFTILLPTAVFLALGKPMDLHFAVLKGFNMKGGRSFKPEFLALLVGLVIYTAAFIGENVRSGLQSVAKGQIEAAQALGLAPAVVMRKVLLPQALRVTIPATTNDYASLVKNSSLAVAIGYPDMVSIGGTIIGQNGQAIEIIGMWMAVYMIINLIISALMNWLNSRVKVVER